jgi:hypothetical protein
MRTKILFIVMALIAYGYYLQATQSAVMGQIEGIGSMYQRAMTQAEEMANNTRVNTELVQYSPGK